MVDTVLRQHTIAATAVSAQETARCTGIQKDNISAQQLHNGTRSRHDPSCVIREYVVWTTGSDLLLCTYGPCVLALFRHLWLSQGEFENYAAEETFEIALWPWEAREA